MHSPGPSRFRVQRGRKDRPEYRGRNLRPVKLRCFCESVLQFLRYFRYHYIFIGKQAAVDVWEGLHLFRQVHVSAVFQGLIQRPKKLHELATDVPRLVLKDVP